MTSTLSIQTGEATATGPKPENQDSHGVAIPSNHLLESKGVAFAIADGVSSSKAGKAASEACINGFLTDYFSTPDSWTVKTSAQKVLGAMNSWLYGKSFQDIGGSCGGESTYLTTFSGVVLKSNTAHIFHAGDSRVYLLRGGNLEQLTKDHRYFVSKDENYLTRAFGIELHLDIDYRKFDLDINDVLILTTDGVHDFLDDKSIKNLFLDCLSQENANCNIAAQRLVDAALESNATDNVTCLAVKIVDLPDPDSEEFYEKLTRLPFPPDLAAGNIIDGYKILREIHSSKRSQCYIALDTDTNEQVVIKTPSVNYVDDALYIKNFLQEEWIGKRVSSPHVLNIHEHTRDRTFLYQITEYFDCQTLRAWMNDNPKPNLSDVRSIVDQISKGLRAFHRLEMIHRDLKPENIIIDKYGIVKILDFGSVKVAGDQDLSTPLLANDLVGTADYTAPEYITGASGNQRSDQFSLAVITYEMLTGQLPFNKPLSQYGNSKRRYISFQEINIDVPIWIESAIKHALNANPEKRYEEITELVYDLAHINQSYMSKEFKPLLERNPAKFWKIISLLLLASNITFLYLLLQ
ncbi:Serine/threonine protein kinase [hydrothermal vent metagenome]|uniref:non-specific serine/threonine protein kinase n=1 Tax=hydrothermal vent metagenome TaxID=652676 RepID=A0A3B0Z1Q1_9ZZZZ